MKIKTIKLENIKCFDSLLLENIDSKNLVILVGENGSGKSTIFDVLNIIFSYIVHGGWAGYKVEDLLKNNKDSGNIYVELILTDDEKKEAILTNNLCFLEINLSRGNNFKTSRSAGINEVRDNIINKRYNKELFDKDTNIKNYGVYIHRSPYRYEDIQDINEPKRNLLKLEEDKNRLNVKAQVQSSRWEIVLSYLLQLDRIIKSRYFEVNSQNLTNSTAALNEAVGNLKALTEDFNYLLGNKSFDKIEETTSDKTYFWIKNDKLKIEFKQLSSGEKEALFLFSDIRRQSPNNSIIAVDEPDLHLHYNLQRKLVNRFIDIGKDNQIFLATHSLAIVKESENNENTVIYCFDGINSPKEIVNRNDFLELYKILADDLSNILTNKAIIFVEGEDKEKDALIFDLLINNPKIHFIPTQDRSGVSRAAWLSLHLVSQQTTPQKLFAITDGDGRTSQEKKDWESRFNDLVLVLSKYSLENYFFDFLIWEKIDQGKKKDPYKSYTSQQFKEYLINKLNTEENIEIATNKILKSRQYLHYDKNEDEPTVKPILKEKIKQSLTDETFIDIFPMKEFIGSVVTDLFLIGLDDFKMEVITIMKNDDMIPEEITSFATKTLL
ncbi:MAG: AAA family ATPase [Candidatus Shapirobacteria bacterium]|nr:AAA family ATPase [Candidatus Shapirobacteria bacterium]